MGEAKRREVAGRQQVVEALGLQSTGGQIKVRWDANGRATTQGQKRGYKCVDPVKPKKHGPFYQLSYSHRGKSTTQFVRPQFLSQVRRQLAAYKRFKTLTEEWVALALELSKAKLEEARLAASKPKRTR
jgi:hypothetical protein